MVEVWVQGQEVLLCKDRGGRTPYFGKVISQSNTLLRGLNPRLLSAPSREHTEREESRPDKRAPTFQGHIEENCPGKIVRKKEPSFSPYLAMEYLPGSTAQSPARCGYMLPSDQWDVS